MPKALFNNFLIQGIGKRFGHFVPSEQPVGRLVKAADHLVCHGYTP